MVFMRVLVIGCLLVVLFGLSLFSLVACSPSVAPKQEKESFSVGLYNLSNEDFVVGNKTKTRISFVLQNQEDFPLDCSVLLVLETPSDIQKKFGRLKSVLPGEFRKGVFLIDMPLGDSSLDLVPICGRLS